MGLGPKGKKCNKYPRKLFLRLQTVRRAHLDDDKARRKNSTSLGRTWDYIALDDLRIRIRLHTSNLSPTPAMDDDFDGAEVRANSSADEGTSAIPDSLAMSKRKRKREKDKERKAKRVKEEADQREAEKAAKKAEEEKKAVAEGRVIAKPVSKKKGKGGEKKREEKEIVEDAVNKDVSMLDPRLMADYLTSRLRKYHKDLSAIELSDLSLPESAFIDTTSFSSGRLLKNLADFMMTLAGEEELKKSSEERGAPHTVVCCGSAVRCVNVIRAVRRFQNKEAMVGKAFAKHLKVEESVEWLNTTRFVHRLLACRGEMLTSSRTGIVVGTPKRILDLIKAGALKLPELKRLVIDASRVDTKGFGIFDLRETQNDLTELLNYPQIKNRICGEEGGLTKVIFF